MKNLDLIGKELFNKVRGRFPSVTIGNEKGEVTNDPSQARFFDFDYKDGAKSLGKISISLDENTVSVMYSQDIVENEDSFTKEKWFGFLKDMRVFAKKRMLTFDTRNITKSNLNKRDYKFLAQQGGETQMSESKLYGTSRISYQDVGNARVTIKHTESIDQERAGGRTQKVGSIYVENNEGERFKYPFKHLNGARAMARHVAEGGKPYDEFGKHITGLSEELANLKKFKTYMNRSSVMAEGLAGYMDVVKDRIQTVKKTVEGLQREAFYKEAFDNYEAPVMEEVPNDVKENWIDELTIRQFNEELADVFPYIYKLIGEATKAIELGPEDLAENCPDCGNPSWRTLGLTESELEEWDLEEEKKKGKDGKACWKGYRYAGTENGKDKCVKVKRRKKKKKNEELEIDIAFEQMMGQFAESDLELEKPKVPVTEFVLSLFDRETGQFPKGETAVLTAVEKDYGEQFITPVKEFISRIQETFNTFNEGHMSGKKCKYCGDEFGKPTTDCKYDAHDPDGDNWVSVDIDSDGDADMKFKAEQDVTVMEPTIDQEEADLRRLAGI